MATRRKAYLLPVIALVLFVYTQLSARQAPVSTKTPEIFNQTLGVRFPLAVLGDGPRFWKWILLHMLSD